MYRRDEILPVFFQALMNGYAGNAEETTIPALPGSKLIPFQLGPFKVFDCYHVSPKPGADTSALYSFGQTIIWHEDVPVWMMQYQGAYDEQVIPFLKRALHHAYRSNNFVGGRGSRLYQDDEKLYVYTNRVEPPNDWTHFRGREEVFSTAMDGALRGWHEYQGMLLTDSHWYR